MSIESNNEPKQNPSDPPLVSGKYDVNDGPVLRDHVYDGIQEFDQKLPNWWLFTFYIAIVAFVLYWVVYYSTDWLSSDELIMQEKLEQINQKKADQLRALLEELDNDVLWQWSQNSTITGNGRKLYQNNCVSCHGVNMDSIDSSGNEMSGLSLADAEWKYGAEPMDLFDLIAYGTPEGSDGHRGAKMTPWQDVVGGEGVAQLVAFILKENKHMNPPADLQAPTL